VLVKPVLILVVLSACYLALAAGSVLETTVQYDEFTDLSIALGLSEDPMRGHVWEPSQARLPMYATAVAYRVMRGLDPDLGLLDVLVISRWMSLMACVLAIWGTATLGFRLFDRPTGLAAAALFALIPHPHSLGAPSPRDRRTAADPTEAVARDHAALNPNQ
jgi:hypothetical protein